MKKIVMLAMLLALAACAGAEETPVVVSGVKCVYTDGTGKPTQIVASGIACQGGE
jgi:hypothetical protein